MLKHQNPKRSQFDPTELEARLVSLEARIKKLEEKPELSRTYEIEGILSCE